MNERVKRALRRDARAWFGIGVVAVIALLALRYGLHAVLLHEEQAVHIGPPQVCPHCEHVVPTMPFCAHCGYAMRAASRSLRSRLGLGEDGTGAPAGAGTATATDADTAGEDRT